MKLRAIVSALLAVLVVANVAHGATPEPVRAQHGMVASTSEIASSVGVEIMQRGGNAVDASVAVALALAVVWPSAGNLGGGGFMLIRRADGTTEIIDYRERAPLAASRDMYLGANGDVLKDASTDGYRAAGTPGTVAGLALALQRHGKLSWAECIEPARKLASEGFVLNHHTAGSLRGSRGLLAKFPESQKIFLRDGKLFEEGERFVQADLAATLTRLKEHGPREFYDGETARLIAADMQANGGLITVRDLKEYEATLRKPLRGTYRGYEIVTMPPPSSGGAVLLEMLNILEHFDVRKNAPGSSDEIHLLVETQKRAFADRAEYMGDADFVKVPVAGLTSWQYSEGLAKSIGEQATPSAKIKAGKPFAYEHEQTTHFTVVDAEGNVVSNTYTLNGGFGSGATARGTGVLLNNEMDDFTSKPGVPNAYGLIQGEANAIVPRKRPLSAMTPTIVLKDNKFYFAVGKSWRADDHQHCAAGDRERDRSRHEYAAGDQRAARASPMDAGSDSL
jgi:gamma-glutamyltranspeptidase/glutathione hydrolase